MRRAIAVRAVSLLTVSLLALSFLLGLPFRPSSGVQASTVGASSGPPTAVQSQGPTVAPDFAYSASGVTWGAGLSAMTLGLPTLTVSVGGTKCPVTGSTTFTHNSTTYHWALSTSLSCNGDTVTPVFDSYATNTTSRFTREVYVKGTYTQSGSASVATVVAFPIASSSAPSVSGPAAGVPPAATSPGSSFDWSQMASFNPVWNSSSTSLVVTSASSTAGSGSFAYDPTLVQNNNCAVAACAYSTSIASGNLLVVASSYSTLSSGGAGAPSISDSKGNTWTQAIQRTTTQGVSDLYATIWYAVASGAGADTVTIGPAAQSYTTFVFEVSGASSSVLGTGSGTGSGCGGSCGTIVFQASASTSFTIYGFAIGTLVSGQTTNCYSGITPQETGYTDANSDAGIGANVVYSTTGVSTPTKFGATSATCHNNSSFNWATAGVLFAIGTTTVTGKCTMSPGGAAQDTVTLTAADGSTPSPSSFACDNSNHSLTADKQTTLTATVGAAAVNQLYRFDTSGALVLTVTFATGNSGGNWFFHDYLTDTVTASYSGTVASVPSLAYTAGGNATTYTLTTLATAKQADHGTSWTVTKPTANFPGPNQRYETSYANSSASAGQVIAPVFYLQWKNSFAAAPSSGSWNSAYSLPVTGTQYASPTTVATIVTANGHVSDSASGWVDDGFSAALPSSFADVSAGTWSPIGPYNFQISTGGNTLNVSYQLSTTTTTSTAQTGGGGNGGGGIVTTATSVSTVNGGPPQVGNQANLSLGSEILAGLVVAVLGFNYYLNHKDPVRQFQGFLGIRPKKTKGPKKGGGTN